MPQPPDRGSVGTEAPHPASAALHALSTADAIALMVDDHRRVTAAVGAAGSRLAAFIDDLVPRLSDGGRLIYVGAGTSGRLGVLDAAECPPTFHTDPNQVVGLIAGGDRSLRRSSEGREDDPRGAVADLDEIDVGPPDTVLGIAAGGTTPYVLGALAHARTRGARTGLLCCAAPPAGVEADHVLAIITGPEVLTGSTRLKAGSATKLALNIITTVAFTRLGKVHGNLMVDLRATNDKLRDRAARILMQFAPELTRDDALALVERAEGRLPVAIIVARTGATIDAARERWEREGVGALGE